MVSVQLPLTRPQMRLGYCQFQGNHAVVFADNAEAVVFINGEWLVQRIIGKGNQAGRGFLQAFGVQLTGVGEKVDAVAGEAVGAGVDQNGGKLGDGRLHAVAEGVHQS